MIYFVFIFLTMALYIVGHILNEKEWEGLSFISWIAGGITFVVTIIMTIALVLTWISIPGTEAKWHEHYDALNYQIDNHLYTVFDRDNLIQRVNSWNEDFVACKAKQKNIWVAIFNPESLEGLDKIDLGKIT